MKRPLPVTLIGFLFIAVGLVGVVYHASELTTLFTESDAGWVLLLRVLAIVGGLFVLRGANWARWLVLGWITFHVVVSVSHSPAELAMHAVLMVVVAVALFYRQANIYFSGKGAA